MPIRPPRTRRCAHLVRLATRAVSPRAILAITPLLVFALLRELGGTEVAIAGGFTTSVVALGANWKHGRAISVLVLLAVAIVAVCASVALVLGDERIYLANDPILDFLMAGVFLTSIALRRPLVGPVVHELMPGVRPALGATHRVFYLATLFAVVMNLFQGATRLALLASVAVGEYIVLGLAVQWTFGALMVLASAWLIVRAARARGFGLADLLTGLSDHSAAANYRADTARPS